MKDYLLSYKWEAIGWSIAVGFLTWLLGAPAWVAFLVFIACLYKETE